MEWLPVGAGLAALVALLMLRDLYGPGVPVGTGRRELDQADDVEGDAL